MDGAPSSQSPSTTDLAPDSSATESEVREHNETSHSPSSQQSNADWGNFLQMAPVILPERNSNRLRRFSGGNAESRILHQRPQSPNRTPDIDQENELSAAMAGAPSSQSPSTTDLDPDSSATEVREHNETSHSPSSQRSTADWGNFLQIGPVISPERNSNRLRRFSGGNAESRILHQRPQSPNRTNIQGNFLQIAPLISPERNLIGLRFFTGGNGEYRIFLRPQFPLRFSPFIRDVDGSIVIPIIQAMPENRNNHRAPIRNSSNSARVQLLERESMPPVLSNSENERKKPSPWTREEHMDFLRGLEQCGKGKWKHISRKFVTTRTAQQVASHAQKYFLRQDQKSRKKPSIHDINTIDENLATSLLPNRSQSSQPNRSRSNQPNHVPRFQLLHLAAGSSTSNQEFVNDENLATPSLPNQSQSNQPHNVPRFQLLHSSSESSYESSSDNQESE